MPAVSEMSWTRMIESAGSVIVAGVLRVREEVVVRLENATISPEPLPPQ